MKRLADTITFITGGGSGIGLAVAQAFLQEGARVIISGRHGDKLARAAKQLNGGDRLRSEVLDVADPGQVQSVVNRVSESWGPIDILFNNAGVNVKRRKLRELSLEDWQLLLRINLDGAFYCVHAILPQMRQRRNGLIINLCSIAGKRASALGGAAYSAAKFGMTALGLCLAAEEIDSGIRVSNIYPGEVDTPILDDRPEPVTAGHRLRILKPEDVAAAVVFVATLPRHVSVPELVIKPTCQMYV